MKAGPYSLRGVLIYVALACLCISDGIGPRLLPYPSAEGEGSARPALREAFAGQQGPLSEGGREASAEPGGTDYKVKKSQFFYASALPFTQSTLARRAANRPERREHVSAPPSLRRGRAPPRIA